MKEYLIANNKIEEICVALGCHHFKILNKEYRCGLPGRNNQTSVSIQKTTLKVAIRTSQGEEYGDIFTLIMKIRNCSFGQANKYTHQLLGLPYKSYTFKAKKQQNNNPLAVFTRARRKTYDVAEEIQLIHQNDLKDYVPFPHISWVREGIMPFACHRFSIGYSFDRQRIVIPERKWDGTDDDYIGVSGRTILSEDIINNLGIPKYTKLSEHYPKGRNIYGLNENYATIQECGYVVVFEGQKSVLKRYSVKDGTAVSIGCNTLSDEQVKILIGLNVDIIIAYDKGITRNHIREECEKFYPLRNVYYIYDAWDVLQDKESPADTSNKIYQYLLRHRYHYDLKERDRLKNAAKNK